VEGSLYVFLIAFAVDLLAKMPLLTARPNLPTQDPYAKGDSGHKRTLACPFNAIRMGGSQVLTATGVSIY